jgi:hypothetical protein
VVAGALAALAASGATPARAATPQVLEETRGPVSIDWAEGTVTARGGAAADLRMPSADLARPGAERRARAAATARLKDALAGLPLGPGRALSGEAIEQALGRAQVVDVEYQSNGGAVVRLRARFGDWLAAEPQPGPALSVNEARLAAAPVLRVAAGKKGGKAAAASAGKKGSKDLADDDEEIVTGAARYRIGAPPAGTHAIAVKIDHDGRWVLHREKADKNDKDLTEKLAGAAIVIYVQKVLR